MEGEDYGMKNKNKQKRFSDDQIRSLESMFESQTKLEPRVKMEIARELGLQPRQVAIWFQNRRARWKSKQIEEDYKVLKANYDNLHSQFQALKMKRQSLHIELQDLSNMLEKDCSNTTGINEGDGVRQLRNEPIGCSNHGLKETEWDGYDKNRPKYHGGDGVRQLRNEPFGCSNHGLKETEWDGYEKNRPKFEQQEEETSQTLKCKGYESDELQDKWSNVHSSGLLDDSCGNVCWWDYWN